MRTRKTPNAPVELGYRSAKFDYDEIEEYTDGASNAEVRFSIFAFEVDDRDFRDPGAGGAGQRADEPM